MEKRIAVLSAWLVGVAFGALSADAGDALAPLVFDTPAENDRGLMILGNGEVGAIAWISSDGTLHTRLQRSDSWNETGCHVKVGAIDYVTGRAVDAGSFRQELSLATGELLAHWASGGEAVSLSYRIQRGEEPLVVCHVNGAPGAAAKAVNWRLYPGGAKSIKIERNEPFAIDNWFCREGAELVPDKCFTVNADRLLPDGWVHENRRETVREMMKYYDLCQATGELGKPDLLTDRVFGAITRTDRAGGNALFVTAVTCLHPCASAAEWEARTRGLLAAKGWGLEGEAARLAQHRAGWSAFWERSFIRLSSAKDAKLGPPLLLNPKLPISYGHDSRGGNVFRGRLTPAADNLFTTNEIRFAATFATTDAKASQRLVDNLTPHKADGFLVDLIDGKVRFIMGTQVVWHPQRVTANAEHAISVRIACAGDIAITLDGETVTARREGLSSARECALVQRAWEFQRYTAACAGGGNWPIRFNGSIFTAEYKGDPDYRRWGSGFWWQNTRLSYYPMLAAGDFDLMQGLFNIYLPLLDFNMRRTRKYLGHGGAYFPECMQPWGDHFVFVYGCRPWAERSDKLQESGWHKYEWVGQLELSLLLLERRAFTGDDDWFRREALPSIREYVRFFDEHYQLRPDGKYDWQPAQALETWWRCTTPMPEVAGLRRVTDLLLALPHGLLTDADRALFEKIRTRIPELPVRKLKDGTTAYAPAASFAKYSNSETPELYCTFPFRLCSFEKPNAELGRRTYAARKNKLYFGWAQDELFAAYLGLTDEARQHLVNRVATNSAKEFRWPAYWGPNFDWVPDQDAGGNIQNIIQSMLIQWDGKKIFLLPAWPKDWNCHFRLHAPFQTTVEGRVVDGRLQDLTVTPATRRKDVVLN